MSFWRSKNGKKITSDSIAVSSDGTTLDKQLIKACKVARGQMTSNLTNTSTSIKYFTTPILNITTTGKKLIIEATAIGFINGGNVDFYINIDGSTYIFGSTSSSTREVVSGSVVVENLPAGSHTIKIGMANSQQNRTSTSPAFYLNSILAFEI